jgi:AmmeMemoRadiSam system protein B/AmmeMemoRadiSam system protein A
MRVLHLAALVLLGCSCSVAGEEETPEPDVIRPPAVAGLFYPGDRETLAAMVDSLLDASSGLETEGHVVSGVVPHAGYVYSGSVAADFYGMLEGEEYELVFLVCSSHYRAFTGMSVFDGDCYVTPLGEVPVAREVCRRLIDSHPDASFIPDAHTEEHSLEVQLPFLQRTLGDGFSIVPIVVGTAYEDQLAFMAELILAEACGRRSLVIASSDLSHYPPEELARVVDRETVDIYLQGDPAQMLSWTLYSPMPQGVSTYACGGTAMALVLCYDRIYPGVTSDVISMATSADAGGDPTGVVGYAAICSGSQYVNPTDWSLTGEEREVLLEIARASVESAVTGETVHTTPAVDDGSDLMLPRGVFVTLKSGGLLRGCIGTIRPIEPLASAVSGMAVSAALEDPRFQPVAESELPLLDYEISVLSPMQILPDWNDVVVGTDGLLLISDAGSGLLLPQVPVEMGWDRTEFLEGLCQKAGLAPDAYLGDVVLYRFQAEVFGGDSTD